MESVAVVALAFMLCCLLCSLNGGTSSSQCLDNVPQYGSRGTDMPEQMVPQLEKSNFYIIPDYTFSCHGNVTQWGACVEGEEFDIVFAVYRLSDDPNLTDCYNLIGNNAIVNGTATDGCITLNVPVSDQISVEPGDVMGLYHTQDDPGGTGIETDITVTNITAWYTGTLQPASPGCQYRPGPDGNFPSPTLAAPVITAVIEPFITQDSSPTVTTASLPTPPHPPITPDTGLRPPSRTATVGIAVGATAAAVVLITLMLLLLIVVWLKCRSRRKARASRLAIKEEMEMTSSAEAYATQTSVSPYYMETSYEAMPSTQSALVWRNQAYRTVTPGAASADQSNTYHNTLREIDAYAALYEEVDLEDAEYMEATD